MNQVLNPDHPMTAFGNENAVKFIGLMLWKLRRHCPNLAIEITVQDMQDFESAFMQGNQQAIVACKGKATSVILQLVDQQSGKQLIVEEGDPNSPNALGMVRMMAARKRATALANRLRHDADVAAVGKPLAYDAAEVLELLVWEPKE